MTTVPYKDTAPAMTDLLGGQVDLMCDQITNTSQQIETGKVKAFGVTTLKRLHTPVLAKLPTLDESGLKGFNVTIWHGLYAPKETPKPAVDNPLRPSHQGRRPVRRPRSTGRRALPAQTPANVQNPRHAALSCALKRNGIVTGPSLIRLTCMSAPNTPAATRGWRRRAVANTHS